MQLYATAMIAFLVQESTKNMNKTSYRGYRSVSLPPGDLLGRVFQLLPQVWMMMMMIRRRIIRIVIVMVRAMMMVVTIMAMMTEND